MLLLIDMRFVDRCDAALQRGNSQTIVGRLSQVLASAWVCRELPAMRQKVPQV
jgi:muramidase (phage lysozyme)